jgi:hypothetical protein
MQKLAVDNALKIMTGGVIVSFLVGVILKDIKYTLFLMIAAYVLMLIVILGLLIGLRLSLEDVFDPKSEMARVSGPTKGTF